MSSSWTTVLIYKLRGLYSDYLHLSPAAAPTGAFTVALSALQSRAAHALDTISDLVRPSQTTGTLTTLPDWLLDCQHLINRALGQLSSSALSTPQPQPWTSTSSIAALTTVAAIALSLLFFAFRYLLMSNRRSFGWSGGRASPFLNAWNGSPSNLSSHFEYIDADNDGALYGGGQRPSAARTTYRAGDELDNPEDPDQIHVYCLGEDFTFNFEPFSISEEKVKVRDLRERVASRLRISPDRVRLVYKGQALKDNAYPLRKYGMKQNSLVTAIVTNQPRDYERAHDSASDSGSDSGTGARRWQPQQQQKQKQQQQQPQRQRSVSSVRHRSDDTVPRVQNSSNGFLAPTGHVPASSAGDRRSRDSLRPSSETTKQRDSLRPSSRGPPSDYRDSNSRRDRSTRRDDERGREREPSRNRATASTTPSSRAPSTSGAASSVRRQQPSPASAPAADPKTPLGKVQVLQATLRTKWLPLCDRFIANPPADPDARKKEYLRLSESVMQLVDKADAIELEGSGEARTLRKSLINEANAIVKELDAVKK